ncbi:MAG: methyltransferase domain-containing protein [Elusimicrobiaceae bacterium]|nr:methyltransferase domain-containing protein [Elusimicrobiaceae bacterium]
MENITNDYLLGKKVKIFQKKDGYKTSSDAVLLSSFVQSAKDGYHILDVGSATGGISLCLAYRLKNANIAGFEIQPDLADLANLSAEANGFSNLKYFTHDIKQKKAPFDFCSFDAVVTNPPYAKDGSVSPNKSKALAHTQNDMTLEQWLSFCLKMLKPFGKLYLIHKAEALDEILNILYQKTGDITILPIYSKKGQNATRVIIRAQKDSKAPLKILPPFVVHNLKGYTPAAEAILRDGKSYFEIKNI